jgi:hypothetical protein
LVLLTGGIVTVTRRAARGLSLINTGRSSLAVHATPQSTGGSGYSAYADDDRGYGWVMFAGTLLLIVGSINFIQGIAAIGNAHFFVHNTHYVAGSLNTWGWVVLCIGVVQFLVGLGVFVKNQLARWVGVVALGVNAIVQLLMMPSYPFWSLTIFTLDILALYGLVAYGQRIAAD